MPTIEQITDALRPVEDPELHRSIVDLGMVKDIAIGPDGQVGVRIALTVAGCPLRNEIQNRVTGAVAAATVTSTVCVATPVALLAVKVNVCVPASPSGGA